MSRIIPLLFIAILFMSIESLFAQNVTADGQVARGRELFLHQWTPGDSLSPNGDGLGPMFNGKSCVECHSLGGVGGSGESKRNAQFLSFLPESGKFTEDAIKSFLGRLKKMHPDFVDNKDQFSFGVLLHRQSTTPEYAEVHGEVTTPLVSNFDSRLRIRRMLSKRNIRPVDALPLKLVTYQDELQYALAERNPPQLFGLDAIDRNITDEDRQKIVEAQTKSRTGVSGRMAGKFGWRGQMRSLDLFVKGACATEIGLQVHEFEQTKDPLRQDYSLKGNDLSEQQVGDLIRYVRSFDMPRQVLPDNHLELETIAEGNKLFTAIGCAECHVADVGRVSGVYSDFLLHNMGTQFEDPIPAEPLTNVSEGARMDVITSYHGMTRRPVSTELVKTMEVGPEQHTEYKTPPLWGIADSAPYMHDGRATTLRAAIEWHGGEAYSSFRRFSLLSEEKQFSLLKFLETLKAPQSAEEAPRELIEDVAFIPTPSF
ncbi:MULTISPECIES: di-heme oxidoredictase family protein [Pirellulaceae]|uniref:di-heme oxidoredictase family protein n=1 Tax=Pirellulaceae TaxID=2691357 RepID=UPI0011AFF307|nr:MULTISPECIES: di-heme oxidoredictase family protein [Pirellulaceae]